MNNEINDIIKLEFEKTGWSVSQFAQKINRDRTIVYHIFKRKIFDTDLLYDISMAFNIDLFKHYSQRLEESNDIIRLRNNSENQTAISGEKKKKVLVEVELTEEEYQDLISKI